MAAVQGGPEEVRADLAGHPEVTIANENSPSQTVIAGPRESVARAAEDLTESGYKVTSLPVSAAFHTSLVEHASRPFAAAVAGEDFQPGRIPVFSNTTGQQYPADVERIKEILSDHILHPVVFQSQIEALYQAGVRVFVEIGPRRIMSGLVEEILDDRPHDTVSLNPSRDKSSDRQLREALVRLRVLGLPLNNLNPEYAG